MALKTQIKRIETARKKYNEELAKLNRRAIAKAIGEVIPPGFALAWNQYTPSFNDGDPCRFTVGEVRLMTIKEVTEVEANEAPDEPEVMSTSADAGIHSMVEGNRDDVAEAIEDDADTAAAEDEPELETTLGDDERSDWDTEDEGTTSLEYGRSSDLKWCGMTAKAFAAVKAAWKLVDDTTILEKAFGDGSQIVIRSGGKFTVEDYDCGY